MPDAATLELTGLVAGSLAPTVTLHDVELVETGVHQGALGPTPVARGDLESMIAASYDPEVDRAAMHPGHFDPRFVQTLADGEPAIGWAVPRRIVDTPDGKAKLIGDLVDVPAKLAAVIPKAYARRSIEFAPKITPSGRAYPAALTGLALLGVAIPAVKNLADVVNRYSAGPSAAPSAAVFLSDTPTPDASLHGAWWSSGHDGGRADLLLVSTEGGSLMARFDTGRYQALLAQEQARHAAMMAGLLSQSSVADEAIPPLPGLPGMPAPASYAAPTTTAPWPPAAAAPAAPGQQFAYDAAGQPVPVAAQPAAAAPVGSPFGYAAPPNAAAQPAAFSPFPPAAAAPAPGWPAAPAQPVPAVPAAQVYPFGQPAPVSAPAPAAPPAAGLPGWPAGQPVPAAHPAMAPTPPPVGGTAYAVPAAPAPGYPPAAGYPAAPPPGNPYAPAAYPPDPAAAAAAVAGMPAVAHLSAGQLAELQLRASRGDQAMQALEAQQREHYLTAAVNEGRISVAERPAWQAAMAAPGAMAHTVGLLSALTPGRVPVAPLGQAALAAPAAGAGGVPDAAWDAWEAETFGTGAPAAAAPAGPAGYPVPGAATFAAHPLGV
jgi:hypothetical protein